jgi:hypothetical protein
MVHNELTQRLLHAQELRNKIWAKHAEGMFDLIPNVTHALEAMLELPPENIKWVEIEVLDEILLMGIAVKFPADDIPMFVQIFAPDSVKDIDEDVETINQLIRVGLPLRLLGGEVGDIIQFFHDIANSSGSADDDDDDDAEEIEGVASIAPETISPIFDSSELTLEQTQKLLLFQHHTSEVKH